MRKKRQEGYSAVLIIHTCDIYTSSAISRVEKKAIE